MFVACDPGRNPGFCVFDTRPVFVTFRVEDLAGLEFEESVIEDQFAASHIFRNGRKVAVSRQSQQTLSWTAGRLFEKLQALRRHRIPVADWRRTLWGGSRLTKPVVLARLRAEYNTLVQHLPKKHQPDVLESIGIAVAWNKLSQEQKAKYYVE